jgi:hypothetical protein
VVETFETARRYRGEGPPRARGPLADEAVDDSTWKQLRDLGYVDGASPEE